MYLAKCSFIINVEGPTTSLVNVLLLLHTETGRMESNWKCSCLLFSGACQREILSALVVNFAPPPLMKDIPHPSLYSQTSFSCGLQNISSHSLRAKSLGCIPMRKSRTYSNSSDTQKGKKKTLLHI